MSITFNKIWQKDLLNKYYLSIYLSIYLSNEVWIGLMVIFQWQFFPSIDATLSCSGFRTELLILAGDLSDSSAQYQVKHTVETFSDSSALFHIHNGASLGF